MPDPSAIDAVIRSRRTINQFHANLPPEELILSALDLARWAPNHKLTEPWRFYLLGAETAAQVVELNTQLLCRDKGEAKAQAKREKWSKIPGWLVVTYQKSDDPIRDRENYAAVCCAIQNLALSLWGKGVGMKWTTGGVTLSEEIYELLNIEHAKEEIVGLLWYGYPAEEPQSHRQPLTDVLKRLP